MASAPPSARTIFHLDLPGFDRSCSLHVEFAQLPYGQVLHNAAPYFDQPNAVEYKIVAGAAGKYRLDIKVAAADPRPIRILHDGKVVAENALAVATGGWEPAFQKWQENQAVLALHEGENHLRLERGSVFPHISELELVLLGTGG